MAVLAISRTAGYPVLTSSTTTTSTTAIPCECLTFENTDILDQEISYIDCSGVTQEDTILVGAINQYCGCCGVANSPYVTITIGADCVQGNQGPLCLPTTTTTTTTYPYSCTCMNVVISQTDLDDATGNTPAPGIDNNTVYLRSSKFSGCDDSEVDAAYTTVGVDGWCIKTSAIGDITLFYYKNNIPIYFPAIDSTYNILYSNCSVRSDCT